jgi:hypothetical protein
VAYLPRPRLELPPDRPPELPRLPPDRPLPALPPEPRPDAPPGLAREPPLDRPEEPPGLAREPPPDRPEEPLGLALERPLLPEEPLGAARDEPLRDGERRTEEGGLLDCGRTVRLPLGEPGVESDVDLREREGAARSVPPGRSRVVRGVDIRSYRSRRREFTFRDGLLRGATVEFESARGSVRALGRPREGEAVEPRSPAGAPTDVRRRS